MPGAYLGARPYFLRSRTASLSDKMVLEHYSATLPPVDGERDQKDKMRYPRYQSYACRGFRCFILTKYLIGLLHFVGWAQVTVFCFVLDSSGLFMKKSQCTKPA